MGMEYVYTSAWLQAWLELDLDLVSQTNRDGSATVRLPGAFAAATLEVFVAVKLRRAPWPAQRV